MWGYNMDNHVNLFNPSNHGSDFYYRTFILFTFFPRTTDNGPLTTDKSPLFAYFPDNLPVITKILKRYSRMRFMVERGEVTARFEHGWEF